VTAWMEKLGVGEYASKFGNKHWKEIIEMGHEDLEMIGINSSRARKIMLDNFWKVKKVLAVKEDYLLQLPKSLLNLTDEEERQLSKEERFKLYYTYIRVDFKLLEDFPAWLKGLKLGRFESNFKGMKWKDIIQLDGDELEQLGIKPNAIRILLLRNFRRIMKVMVI
ncbi:13971_t:CDS:2, partial [Acaulospora colombiana]